MSFLAPAKSAPAAGKMGGAEMMLRSAGLGGVLDAANQLAASGAVEKIIGFADQLPGLVERLEAIEHALRERGDQLELRAGGRGPGGDLSRAAHPGPGPAGAPDGASDPGVDGPGFEAGGAP